MHKYSSKMCSNKCPISVCLTSLENVRFLSLKHFDFKMLGNSFLRIINVWGRSIVLTVEERALISILVYVLSCFIWRRKRSCSSKEFKDCKLGIFLTKFFHYFYHILTFFASKSNLIFHAAGIILKLKGEYVLHYFFLFSFFHIFQNHR